jgi:hypothetical protein
MMSHMLAAEAGASACKGSISTAEQQVRMQVKPAEMSLLRM